MAFDCMEDCVHLKACRRVQAIGRRHRLMVPRYCTEECSAYVSRDSVDREIKEAINWAFERGRDGDVWITVDSTGLIDTIVGGENDEIPDL